MRLAVWLLSALLCTATAVQAEGFDLQGHRGARALAPENTLAGFTRAFVAVEIQGFDMLA